MFIRIKTKPGNPEESVQTGESVREGRPAHRVQKMHDPYPKICRTFKRLFENPPRNFRLAVDLRSRTLRWLRYCRFFSRRSSCCP